MHTLTRPWNLPFGLALAGGIFLAGGALIWPFARAEEPPPVNESAPSGAEPCPAPENAALDPDAAGPVLAANGVGDGPTPLQDEDAGDGDGAPPDAADDAGDDDADEDAGDETGGDANEDANGDANDAEPDDAAQDAAEDGTTAATTPSGLTTPSQDAAPSVNDPFVYPVFGAPPPETVTGPPIVAGDEGNETTPLYVGPSGGTTNPGIVDPKPAIAPSLLVPFGATTRPEGYWTSISPFLRPGDVVVAHVSDGSTLAALAPWSERVRVDLPLVSYALAFDRPAQLESALAAGLPDTVTMVGLASADGVDDATFAALATKARASGKKTFVSLTVPSSGAPKGPSYATISAHADVVELVVPGEGAAAAAKSVKPAVATLQSVRRPQLHLRLGSDALSTTARHAGRGPDAASAVIPGIGIAMAPGPEVGRTLSDLRGTPPPP